ncbi:P-loop containing nucleoside triphosphate hydrolase protein, partial [Mycena albidolilacea]
MMEHIHQLLYAIICLHIKSDTGELSPSMLSPIGIFTETLHKVNTFMEAQQHGSRIRKFFRQGEMNILLKECNMGLQQALNIFGIQSMSLLTDINKIKQYAKEKHEEVLELIASLSDANSSDQASSMNRVFSSSYNSSTSFSMLPSEPKIFHGRESELVEIIQLFTQESPRIAILGAGGMGKTTIARAVVHHHQITRKYAQQRYFVMCDSVSTAVGLAALLVSCLELKAGKNLTEQVVHHFVSSPPSLLILDNLETLWEPLSSRGDIEEFLSCLTDIQHLALIITMRGSERPAKVRWTRPFLLPLQPLTQDAARKTFIDITDDLHNTEDIDKILLLTDNMPLAIDLMAHLVDSEGCYRILARWEEERTSLVSDGYNKQSNLDLSISLSLSSPRLISIPNTVDLLSILSILPDGISDNELLQCDLHIKNILTCKASLLRTSLAYNTEQKRLKVLLPIREYMQKFHPAPFSFVHPILTNFHNLLEL